MDFEDPIFYPIISPTEPAVAEPVGASKCDTGSHRFIILEARLRGSSLKINCHPELVSGSSHQKPQFFVFASEAWQSMDRHIIYRLFDKLREL